MDFYHGNQVLCTKCLYLLNSYAEALSPSVIEFRDLQAFQETELDEVMRIGPSL